MTSTPEHPAHDGSDLAKLRQDIDGLKSKSEHDLISPTPKAIDDMEGHPTPTDAMGFEDWNNPIPPKPNLD